MARLRAGITLSFLLFGFFSGCFTPPDEAQPGVDAFRYGDVVTYDLTSSIKEWHFPARVTFTILEPFTYQWLDGRPREGIRVAFEIQWPERNSAEDPFTDKGFIAVDQASGRAVYKFYFSEFGGYWISTYAQFGQPFGFGSGLAHVADGEASCYDRGTPIATRAVRDGATLRIESDADPPAHDRAWMPCVGEYKFEPGSPWVAEATWVYRGQNDRESVGNVTAWAKKVHEERGSESAQFGSGPLPPLPAADPLPPGAIPGYDATRGHGLTLGRIVEWAKNEGPGTKEFLAQNPQARVSEITLLEPNERKCGIGNLATCIHQTNWLLFVTPSRGYWNVNVHASKQTWPNPGDWTFTEGDGDADPLIDYPSLPQRLATKAPVQAAEQFFSDTPFTDLSAFSSRVEAFTNLHRFYWYEFILSRTNQTGVVFNPPRIMFQSDTGLPDHAAGPEDFMSLLKDGVPFGMAPSSA